ncbi:DUF1918 domain-containing protein [Streptomyces sp. 1222.5]|uniref:DUF1918 domain-containing protein n=1 Tax=Streptomyces sp. 1222.5 TaxID=1881026 RepID=UPI003D73C1B5
MRAEAGDRLLVHGRRAGRGDRVVEIVEVLGDNGEPPFRIRAANGRESIVSPGPDCVVQTKVSEPDAMR